MENSPPYSFRQFIAADLTRHHKSFRGSVPSGLRFWASALSPRFIPVLLCRLSYRLHTWKLSPLAKMVSLVNFTLFGIEIAVSCPIGPGLLLPHTQGTVIGAAAIGANAVIFQGVTIGAKEFDAEFVLDRRPTIGSDVVIGSGAKVLGGITVGDGARIGANTVVIEPVPPGALAVGAGTRILLRSSA